MSPAPPGRLPVTWLPPGSTPGPFWSASSVPAAPVLVLIHSNSPFRLPPSGASLSLIVACHTGALVSTQSGSDKLAEQAEARVWPLAGLKTSRVPALVGTFGALRQKNFTTIEEASNRFHDHWSSADSSPAVPPSRSVIQSHWCSTGKFRTDRPVPGVVPKTQPPAFGPLVYHSSQYPPARIPPKSALVGFQSPPADPSVRFHASDQVGFCDAWSVFHDGSMNTGYITDPPDSTDASGVSVTAPAAADTAITAT